jgi:hypothetical protein
MIIGSMQLHCDCCTGNCFTVVGNIYPRTRMEGIKWLDVFQYKRDFQIYSSAIAVLVLVIVLLVLVIFIQWNE